MRAPSGPDREDVEANDETGHPGETIVIDEDQQALIDTIIDDERPPVLRFEVANDQENGIYTAVADGREIGGIVYSLAADRIVLQAASVHVEFRHQGVATELIRRVLDDVRTQGKTTTILCPIVRTFIDEHPEYADLVDAGHPGLRRTDLEHHS
jgi:predicted GNAT family acetyltransferase